MRPAMAKRRKKKTVTKRNLAAREALAQKAGPMKDKREISRQQQRVRDEKTLRERDQGKGG